MTDESSENQDESCWEPLQQPDGGEPLEGLVKAPPSRMRLHVAQLLDDKEREARQAETVEREENVRENVEGVMAAVDALLLQEDDDSTGTPPPPKTQQTSSTTRHRESRLKLRRRLRAAREKLKLSLLVQPVARLSRRVVTGSNHTRIRDFVVLPKVVRILDTYTFTGGVLGMLITEFIMLQYPSLFRYYNVITMLPLLLLRVVLFTRTKQQYFLLDYCYWVNGLGFALALFPWHDIHAQQIGWQIFFISANGPLFFAMIAWNNSLVFHSVDKVTSTYVHLFPALLCWCEHWQAPQSPMYYQSSPSLTWSQMLGYPLLFYALWQTVYLIQTEWWHKPLLDADPDLSTSLRYLTSAHKMAINKKALQLCRNLRIMKPQETFHPATFKVKVIFVVLQMIMTVGTFLPVGLFYQSMALHTSVVLSILIFSCYNGARYYVQVFSKIHDQRYYDGAGEDNEYVDTSLVMTEHTKKQS